MYKFVCIELMANHLVSHKERKEYLTSLYGSLEKHKLGMIEKFNNAYGFKNVEDDITTNYPVVNVAKIKSPKDYKSPSALLYKGLKIDLDKKGVVKFIVPLGSEKHPIEKYAYSHKNMMIDFSRFLQKVYPDLNIEYSLLQNYSPILKYRVLNIFYQNMSEVFNNYTVECSAARLLKNEELNYIEGKLREMVTYPFHIEQYFCETCQGYNPKQPYHIEIVYD